ncbi:MAG: hypothetical protein IID44_20980 [Planctomycetes bacterium]|nr:hypothetical protein [Planctomycetota bacterium]
MFNTLLKWLLEIDQSQQIAGLPDVELSGGWLLAVPLLVAAVALVVFLYRSETRLSRGRRTVMAACQGLALLTLILMLLEPVAGIRLIQPYRRTVLVLVDSSRSMLIEDQRTTIEDVGEAAGVLGKLSPGQQVNADTVDAVRQSIGPVSRINLARAALGGAQVDGAQAAWLDKLNEQYQVRFFSFDERLKPEGGAEDPTGWLKNLEADGETSQVGTAIEEAVARYAGQPIAGVVVLGDFAWANGRDPVEAARNLKQQGIPVFPVTIGLPKPPDVHLRRVVAPEVVFKGDRVPLRIQIESHGFAGDTVELVLDIDGERVTRQQVELKDGIQFEEMMFIPQRESGTVTLDLSVTVLAGETTEKNNAVSHKVQIIDEKIKVLYIEGMPRWEYRYLRWVLLRDPRLDVKFLMTQGDPALAKTSPQHLGRFPQVKKDAFRFDLIILGDVPASYFNATQMELIEDLVKIHGGSLLMVAGPMKIPGGAGNLATYRDTRIANILPVKLGNGQWETVNAGPVVTPAGRESSVTTLSLSPETNQRIWSHVRPMYLPVLEGAKPGATVLLTKPKDVEEMRDYPLIAWHRYGTGKSMFVATEDLWRMRLEVGDKYHARFWGQAIQFLTLSRLLGKNKQVTLETDRRTYSAGEQVRVFANVLTQSFEPVEQPSYTVILDRKDTADAAAEMELSPVPGSPGLYSGVYLASEDGDYLLKTKDQDLEVSNQVDFTVATIPLEDRETAMQADVARQIAEQSGGKRLGLLELENLAAELGDQEPLSKEVRLQIDLWDKPVLFVLLVLFAGTEWYLRRRDNLV